jgi:cytochrome c oxidase subunit 2
MRPASRLGLLPIPATLLLTGCGRENMLDPASPQGHKIATLFWVMMGVAWLGIAFITFLLALGWLRRKRQTLPGGGGERIAAALVVSLGVAAPIVSLAALFVWSDVFVLRATSAPKPSSTSLTVEVIGHQWWWEVRYPGTRAVTANEIHIPVGARVNLVGKTADVIHSFSVPQLNRKIDLIPGRTNRIVLEASRAGRFRGQCYEFCGLQHAHMGMYVVAEPRARFRAWLANMSRNAREPRTPLARQGRSAFLAEACSGCHQIRGTPAHARVGPDLTHLATRETIAAAALQNRKRDLGGWISDPQHDKPGARMPALGISDSEVRALVAYLESLR